jgi:hypothetical protein
MATRLVTQVHNTKCKNAAMLWRRKGAAVSGPQQPFFALDPASRNYCGVRVISSNVRLRPVLAGFFPTTVNVKR